MLQFIFSYTSIIISTIFMKMKHPLAMGIMLLVQTFLVCMIIGTFSETFWFSYVLFMVFLGGMLILFIYVTSLASNEMFVMSMKLMIYFILSLIMFSGILFMMDKSLISNFIMNTEMSELPQVNAFLKENSIMLNKLYSFPINNLTLLMINYLFLTLIAIVKITNIHRGPLRPMN